MIYKTLAETTKAMIKVILDERKTEINLRVLPEVIEEGSIVKSIYEAAPRLILCIDHMQSYSENHGSWLNIKIHIEYTDNIPSNVYVLSSPTSFMDVVLQTVKRHRRKLLLVYASGLHADIHEQAAHLLKSYKILNCFVNGFQMDKSHIKGIDFTALTLTFTYSCTYTQWVQRKKLVREEIDHIVQTAKSCGIEDWKKAQAVIRYCIDHWTYGDGREPGLQYTAYGALINKTAVCMGFSLAICEIFKALGIPCRFITGTRDGEGHAWNMVYIRGGWFYIDVTDAITMRDPLFHWGMVQADDRIPDMKITEKLVCHCNDNFIRSMRLAR